MIARRAFVAGMAAVMVAPLGVEAQQAGRVYRIGFLGYAASCDLPLIMTPFREGLRAHGYVEGQNIAFECSSGPSSTDRVTDLAAELARLKVDVIVADGTALALAAKRATNTIPIVMVIVADPVGSGLVDTLERPGGNITGFSVLSPGVVPKALSILKELSPRLSRVGVLMDPTNPSQTLLDKQMNAAADTLRITTQRFDVRTAANLDGAFATAVDRIDALSVYPLPIEPAERQRIVQFAIKHRLPTVAISSPCAHDGMLVAYGVSGPDLYRRAGSYVDRILRGTKPAALPLEQATKFDLVINLKTARTLGLAIPPSLLLRADQVIE
jgi:putative tryptophan/tyrosine transport system substrate-binding protein